MTVELIISGKVVLIDRSELGLVKFYKSWHVNNCNYAIGYGKGLTKLGIWPLVSMHQLIACPVVGQVVDHINGNTLDNRCANLRCCSVAQNNMNRVRKNGAGLLGVNFVKREGRWRARLRKNGRQYSAYFSTEAEAIAHRIHLEQIHYGEFAPTASRSNII